MRLFEQFASWLTVNKSGTKSAMNSFKAVSMAVMWVRVSSVAKDSIHAATVLLILLPQIVAYVLETVCN